MDGNIFNIQPFSIHDGTGFRTIIFFKGCNLQCFWCHNPESLSSLTSLQFYEHKCIHCNECITVCPQAQSGKSAIFTKNCLLCNKCADACFADAIEAKGYRVTSNQLFDRIVKDKEIFIRSGGGVTFSGGEPLLQIEFLEEILTLCKNEGINTVIETALCVPWEKIAKILPLCDAFLCDLKSLDNDKHKKATRQENTLILQNISALLKTGKPVTIRTPIIPDFNDTIEDIQQIASFFNTLDVLPEYELLPFQGMCKSKYDSMGIDYQAKHLKEPTQADIMILANAFTAITGKKTINHLKIGGM